MIEQRVLGDIEQVRKPLRKIVLAAILEKTRPGWLKLPGNLSPYVKHEVEQLFLWQMGLMTWARDPEHPQNGVEGYGFELLVLHMLKTAISKYWAIDELGRAHEMIVASPPPR